MAKREYIKGKQFGSYEDVRRINACTHVYVGVHGAYFGYIRVDWQCVRCGTFAAESDDDDRRKSKTNL